MSYTSLAAEFDAALERISETYRAMDAFADDDDSLPARSAREAYSRAKLIYRSVELRLRAAHLRRSSAPKRLLIYASESRLGDSLAALTSAWGFASVLVASLDDARGVGTIDADIAVVAYIEPTRSGEHIWRSLQKSLPGHPIVLVASRLPTVTPRLLSVSSLRAELKFLQSMPRRSPKPEKVGGLCRDKRSEARISSPASAFRFITCQRCAMVASVAPSWVSITFVHACSSPSVPSPRSIAPRIYGPTPTSSI